MPEQQNIKYKSSWHDDHLKWICGFANASGGCIYVGVDDIGNVVGVEEHKRLMDDIPNKIKSTLGIVADVNLLQKEGKYYIEIAVPPYSVPISLRGRYYYRSGSVKQELTGLALNEFLLKRVGQTWDDVAEPRASFEDIDERAFRAYLVMSKEKGRLPDVEGLSMEEIFEKLQLSENGQLKRAAIIMFGKDPKRFYMGSFVKIGRFSKNDADLRYQDVEEGNIIVLLRNVLERLDHKYLTRSVEFEGMYRNEKSEYPVPALREILLNSLIHRDYMGSFVQIKVYDDKISVWNDGSLPMGLSMESLRRPHSSKPRNRIIADVCFKGGLIDAWGSGTIRIIDACKESGLPEPELAENSGGFLVTLFKNMLTDERLKKMGLNERQIRAVSFVKENGRITGKEYQEINGISKRTSAYEIADMVKNHKILKRVGESVGTYYEFA